MLPAVLALSGNLVIIAVVAAIVGLIAVAIYSIRTLRSDEGWEERPPKQDDIDMQ
jgi:hypothetical protein